ncbi:ribosome biogenesis BOP1 homolog, partial [Olea europaea subsp. europaea]
MQAEGSSGEDSIASEDISDIDTEDEEENDESESEQESDEENEEEENTKSRKHVNSKNIKLLEKMKLNNNKNAQDKEDDNSKQDTKIDKNKSGKDVVSAEESKKPTSAGKARKTKLKGKSSVGSKEYENETDTSDEEDIRNTVGNIPMNWYDDLPHLGYDWGGKKILKPEQGDQLDEFLSKMENPNFWRSVKDPQTGQNVVLSDADIQLIKNIRNNKYPDPEYNEYAPWVDWFSSEVMKMPLNRAPDHKRSFIPSKSEAALVSKFVYSLKMGWMKKTSWMKRHRKDLSKKKFYMLWSNDTDAEEMRRIHNHIPAPKRFLPGHAESYNPPQEYLFNERE